MRPVDWATISDQSPNPLPTSIEALDALVRRHRPEFPFDGSNSKQRKRWRESFAGYVRWHRWKQANPQAKCLNCNEYEPEFKKPRCGLGYEKGGWFTEVKSDHVCPRWRKHKGPSS